MKSLISILPFPDMVVKIKITGVRGGEGRRRGGGEEERGDVGGERGMEGAAARRRV